MAGPDPQNKLVAFVSNNAWSVYNFRLDVIVHLLRQGYEVIVFSPKDEYVKQLTDAGCRFIPIEFDNKSSNPVHDLLFYQRLKQLYAQYKPGFIFHFVAKPNIYGTLAAAANGIHSVAVITGLGYAFDKKNWLYYVVRQLYRFALKQSKEVWFLNKEDARVFIDQQIIPIDKIKILPGEGVNTRKYAPAVHPVKKKETPFSFLMSSRLLKSKGIGLYVDAAKMLKRKHYDVQFELIGFFENHHPDSIQLEELQKWEREGILRYSGFAKDVRPFLERAHCFVFPSFYNEGVPRCLLEAASMELPIITTFNRGCKEVVLNNSNGFICNPHDAIDLADKMEKMINLPLEDRLQMGRNGRQLILKKFNVEKVIEEYVDTLGSEID